MSTCLFFEFNSPSARFLASAVTNQNVIIGHMIWEEHSAIRIVKHDLPFARVKLQLSIIINNNNNNNNNNGKVVPVL
jgi:hypothetical protein